jgi:hypothetical protein
MRPLVTIPLHIRAWHSRRQVCRLLQCLRMQQQLVVPTLLLQVQLRAIGIGPMEQQQQEEEQV